MRTVRFAHALTRFARSSLSLLAKNIAMLIVIFINVHFEINILKIINYKTNLGVELIELY